MIRIENEGRTIFFEQSENPKTSNNFIDLAGGKAKFALRRDPLTQNYLTLSNVLPDSNWLLSTWHENGAKSARGINKHIRQRNVMALRASRNLYDWRVVKVLLAENSGLQPLDSVRFTAYQYVDWKIDGDDLIYVVRTAARGARNFHYSNRTLFSREENFRAPL